MEFYRLGGFEKPELLVRRKAGIEQERKGTLGVGAATALLVDEMNTRRPSSPNDGREEERGSACRRRP